MTKQKQMTQKELDQVAGGPAYIKVGDKESSRTIKFRIERKNTSYPIHCITPSLQVSATSTKMSPPAFTG